MKDHLRHLVENVDGDVNQKICAAREYLQARTLQSFQEDGVFTRWAFQGGTALRFLFSIPRFSEDLDFALIHAREDAHLEPFGLEPLNVIDGSVPDPKDGDEHEHEDQEPVQTDIAGQVVGKPCNDNHEHEVKKQLEPGYRPMLLELLIGSQTWL